MESTYFHVMDICFNLIVLIRILLTFFSSSRRGMFYKRRGMQLEDEYEK